MFVGCAIKTTHKISLKETVKLWHNLLQYAALAKVFGTKWTKEKVEVTKLLFVWKS